MTLWFDLNSNSHRIGAVEIKRLEEIDGTPATADTWSTYEVRRDGQLIGQVRHLFPAGWWKLLALAASLIAEHDNHRP